MLRILSLLFILSLPALGQSIEGGGGLVVTPPIYPPQSGFTPSCTPSSNFLARATTVTLTADKTAYDTLICGLNTDGELSKLDVLYIWAAPDQTAALLNLVSSSFAGTTNGTVSFAAYTGYTGDGSTFYIDSGFTPSTASSPNYTQNSASLGGYDLTNRTSGGNLYFVGLQGGNGTVDSLAPSNFGGTTAFINSSNTGGSTTNAQGAYSVTTTASTVQALYYNDSETPIGTGSTAASAVPNASLFFFAFNNTVSGVLNTTDQGAAGWIGGGLTAADSCKIARRINTYMTTYSINVFTNGGSGC